MKLFSAIKPCLNNMSAAKCYKAITITRWLLFIIFMEKTAINMCRFLLFSLWKYLYLLYLFWFSACLLCFVYVSLHLSGWRDIIDSCYWSKCGNSDFVILYLFLSSFESNALKSLLLGYTCCYWDTAESLWNEICPMYKDKF